MRFSPRHLVLLLLWAGMIFLSSATSAGGQDTSLPSALDWTVHNGAHFLIYGVLAWLMWRTLSAELPFSQKAAPLTALVVCLAVAYGISDEWHQSLVPGREASAMDLSFDFVGSVLGLAVGKFLSK